MKSIKNIIVLILTAFSLNAQVDLPIDSSTNKITYSGVVNIDSTSKNDLYAKAKEWVALAFKSANDVIQLDDAPNGKLIAKGITVIKSGKYPAGNINFTLKIETKDNKYRYEITDLHHTDGGTGLGNIGVCEDMIKTKSRTFGISNQKGYNRMLESMNTNVLNLIADLKLAMAKKTNDW